MQALIQKAQNLRLVIFDVDGVLTSGALYYGLDGIGYKVFHVHDGHLMKMLQESGVQIGIITGCKSAAVAQRMRDLNISHVYQGISNKLPAYEELKQKLKLTDEQIGYVGDDLPDLPVLRRVGFAVTVPNAPKIIQDNANWVTQSVGGAGAAREVCEFIMKAQGTYQPMIDSYLK